MRINSYVLFDRLNIYNLNLQFKKIIPTISGLGSLPHAYLAGEGRQAASAHKTYECEWAGAS